MQGFRYLTAELLKFFIRRRNPGGFAKQLFRHPQRVQRRRRHPSERSDVAVIPSERSDVAVIPSERSERWGSLRWPLTAN